MVTSDDQELDLEAGRLLFKLPTVFMLGVAQLEQLPPADRPEIAFAGRSNVGKSSLINALTGTRNLARTSNTPGRTQQLNFFDVGEGRLNLVDMPGYGYAKAPLELVKQWQAVLAAYLRGRPNLRRALVLIDSRHGLKSADIDMLDMLDATAVPYRIVLTKGDKIKAPGRRRMVEELREQIKSRPAAFPNPLMTSSEKGEGIEELRALIAFDAD